MRTISVTFENRTGYRLAGLMDTPDGAPARAYAILAHCFTCGKDLKPFAHIASELTKQGLGVLRFDFSGLGQSGGDFSGSNLTSNEHDLIDAAGFLAAEYQAPALLIGHSLGGIAVIRAAPEIASIRAVATIAAPADPTHLGQKLLAVRRQALAEGQAPVEIGGRQFVLKRQFFEDLEAGGGKDVSRLEIPILILHSPVDRTVDIENAARLFEAARHPKSFVSLGLADHLMLDPRDARYAGRVLGAWVGRYLEPGGQRRS